jgi:hypothetical protein
MRIVIGIILLVAGGIAVATSMSAVPQWRATGLLANNDSGRVASIANIAGDGSAIAAPAAEHARAPVVSPFETTLTRVAQPADDSEPAPAPTPFVTTTTPADPATRAALARDIQIELARLGCYAGPADGQWSLTTQRAASLFVSEANAVIPVTEPDFVLLSLARSANGDQSCGPAVAINTRANMPSPAMGLGGPAQGVTPPAEPAYHKDRDVQSLFTNPLGR